MNRLYTFALALAFVLVGVTVIGGGAWFILRPTHSLHIVEANPEIKQPIQLEPGEAHDPDGGVTTSTLDELSSTPTTSVPSSTKPVLPPTGKRPQFVTLAFDGSYSLDMWQKTRAFASEMSAKGSPVHFTYFASGVYLLPAAARNAYQPPQHPAGSSAIGFAISDHDVANRIEQINLAIAEGHEIGSHANGHYDGSTWTVDEWKQELSAFNDLISRAESVEVTKGEPTNRSHINLPQEHTIGFRAPELGRNAAMYDALSDLGYRYDTSGVGKPDAWPVKDGHGLWLFPLAKISYATTTSSILSMDYNFYFKQSAAKDIFKKGTPEWQRAYDEMLTSFTNYFDKNYEGNRAPVTMGNHFSEWNDGLYWEVMKDFAREECSKPEVRCVTFSELADWMDANTTTTKR
jgi:hypothetical protein